MRQNPRILSLHMSMAASYWRDRFESGEFDAAQVHSQFLDMARGMRMYLTYDYERSAEHLKSVYKNGCVSLMQYAGHDYKDENPALILVPSLVNKSHIFDLTEKRSMLRYFCAQGINAYLLDWGDFLLDPDMQAIDDLVLRKLGAVAAFLKEETGGHVHALGYCMGGTLLAGLACHKPELFRSCVFMAAPWDFHAGTQDLLNRVKFWFPSLQMATQTGGEVKVDWFQTLFASLFPGQAMQKFAKFSHMDMASEDARIFVAVEDWLNDGVPFPAPLAETCIREWFLENAPASGQWLLDGRVVDPSQFRMPAFIVSSSRDTLVEYDTSVALYDQLAVHNSSEKETVKLLDPECGHVGMVASKKAIETVWDPIATWVKQH